MKRLVKTVLLGLAASVATPSLAANYYWHEKSTSDVTQAKWFDGIGTWSSDVYFVTEPDFTDGKWTVRTLDFSNIDPETTTINKLCISNGIEDDRVVTLTGGAKFANLYAGYYADHAAYSGRFILDGDYTTGYLELGPWYGQAYAITGMVTVATSSTLEVTGDAKLGTSTKGVGILEVNGDMTIGGNITAGFADSGKGYITVDGGTVYSTRDPNVGMSGTGILTVGNGGAFWSGTEFGSRVWTQIAMNAGSTGTINLNAGGEMYASQIKKGAGSAYVNFNGGRLTVIFGGDTLLTSGIEVTVGAQGGTIDTAGYSTTIATAIDGEGTLTITGGGTITFEAVPTCPVFIEEGVVVCTSTTTPAHIAFGKNGFLKYDLSSITENSYQLASNMDDIGLPEGDVLEEHVIILNGDTSLNGDTRWTVYQEDTDLFAVISEDSSTTIWTGAYSDKWLLYPKNWTNGRPTLDSKMIVPYASQVNLGGQSLECGSVEIRTTEELNIYANPADNNHIWLTSVTGSGTLRTNCPWIETSDDADCNIDVPLKVLANNNGSHFKTRNGKNLNINNTLTIPDGVTTSVEGGNDVHINGDLVVDGTWRCSYPTAIAAGKTLSGSGTIEGPVEVNGIVAPGTNTAETLTVTGAATFNSGSSLLVTIGEDGASSRLALTGEGTVDVSNLSIDVANKSALHHRSGYEYTIMTVDDDGSIVGNVAGTVTADDGSIWKAFVSEDGKSLVLRERRSGLLIMIK